MALNIYLTFDGNCRDAVEYYAATFGVPVQDIMTFGSMKTAEWAPPAGAENLVMHTWLEIEGATLMFSDNMPGMPFTPGNNFSLTVTENAEKVKQLFGKMVADGGKSTMELQKTEWSPLYGMVTDKFGIPWMFNASPAG